jgi:hypothetical protein
VTELSKDLWICPYAGVQRHSRVSTVGARDSCLHFLHAAEFEDTQYTIIKKRNWEYANTFAFCAINPVPRMILNGWMCLTIFSYYKQSSTPRYCEFAGSSGFWAASRKSSMVLLNRAGFSSCGAWPVFFMISSLAVPFRELERREKQSTAWV